MPYLNKVITEVCVESFDMAVQAQKVGAWRIELCASLVQGGLTPPMSLMQMVCDNVTIPVHMMIRPRGGDFLYTRDEFELMKSDIVHAKATGATGVVFGILHADGSVDVDRCRTLIEFARPMKVTFHRAFDMTVDPFLAMEEIITLGFDILLTSGQRQIAEDGLEMIRELVKRANNRISVMAGGGVNGANTKLLYEAGVKSFHFTSQKLVKGKMQYRNEALQAMGVMNIASEYDVYEFDVDKFNGVLEILKSVK